MRGQRYTVESGIEFPKPEIPKGESSFPFAIMNVDDSFLVPYSDYKRNTVSQYVGNANRRLGDGRKFASRDMPEEGGVRVWRVK